ncbi:MAG: hypothetical protein JSR66_08380 [Proteobacteria bacterium]|nr:hypothetical protein [Pseudomonadota bacterium]
MSQDDAPPADTWSVDFVEHLRSVHFSLIALSAGLLVVVVGSQDRNMTKAITQATQIAELESRWAIVQTDLVRQVMGYGDQPVFGDPQLYSQVKGLVIEGTTANDTKPESYLVNFTIQPKLFIKYVPKRISPEIMSESPHTIAQFKSWWERLREGFNVKVPSLASIPECVAFLWDSSAAQHHLPHNFYRINCSIDYGDPSDWNSDEVFDVDADSDSLPKDMMGELGDDTEFISGHMHYNGHPVLATSELPKSHSPKTDLYVGVYVHLQSVRLNESAFQRIFPDWRTGPFDSAFRELAVASRDNETISITDALHRMVDSQSKGEQTVEAMGLKIPAPELTRWGVILIVCVQIYFWLHLRQFSRRIKSHSPGLGVAWIGVYGSTLAMVTTLLSACLLPAATLTILLRRILYEFFSISDIDAASWAAILISLVGCGLTLITAASLRELHCKCASI